jgi:hypothetical protein
MLIDGESDGSYDWLRSLVFNEGTDVTGLKFVILEVVPQGTALVARCGRVVARDPETEN